LTWLSDGIWFRNGFKTVEKLEKINPKKKYSKIKYHTKKDTTVNS